MVCPACRDSAEDDFQRVREYVYDHQGVTIQETAIACDVTEKMIRQWLREERLELVHASGEFVCEVCGRPIINGRYCGICKEKLLSELKSVEHTKKDLQVTLKKEPTDRKDKMRFL